MRSPTHPPPCTAGYSHCTEDVLDIKPISSAILAGESQQQQTPQPSEPTSLTGRRLLGWPRVCVGFPGGQIPAAV